jgi:hypothetical protein
MASDHNVAEPLVLGADPPASVVGARECPIRIKVDYTAPLDVFDWVGALEPRTHLDCRT